MAEVVQMIALSPTMERGKIMNWLKSEGDSVSSGDLLCEVETDKAVMEYEAVTEGILLKILVPEGNSVDIGVSIAVIGEEGEEFEHLLGSAGTEAVSEEKPGQPEAPQSQPASGGAPSARKSGATASPLARKMADELGIPIASITGTGPGGRVVKRDVESYKRAPAVVATPVAVPSREEDRVVPVSGMRSAIATRLAESKYSAPHYYLSISVDLSHVIATRRKIKGEGGVPPSFNAFLIRLVASALRCNRRINATWRGDSILEFGSIDIALAVALEDGLITPVVRGCGTKGVREIDENLQELIKRARSGGLSPEEYSNSTFTISNLGSFGIEEFTAIINPPGSAILAVGSVVETLKHDEAGQLTSVPLLKMTLSCDHRVIDGAVGARFLGDLKGIIEDPIQAIM